MTKKPSKSILDPTFRYRNAASTDVRKTWRRELARRRLEKHLASVTPMRKVA